MRTRLSFLRERLLKRFLQSLSVRRQRILAWKSMERAGVLDARFERDGLIWNTSVYPFDEINRQLFIEGGFQVAEMQALLGWAQRFGVFSGSRNVLVDAGANIGTTCIPVARAVGCRALAIEPVSENFARLRQNVDSNGLAGDVLVVQKAIAMQAGRVRMCITSHTGDHFVAGGDDADLPAGLVRSYEDIEGETLAGIITSSGLKAEEIALVWSDVQGCELAVIESGRELWNSGVPLWAEVEPHLLGWQGTLGVFAESVAEHFDRFIDSRDLVRLGAGAHPRPIAGFGEVMDALTPEQRSTDVLFLPRGFRVEMKP